MANVIVTPEAREQLKRLPKGMHARLWKLIGRLENWPDVSGVKALTGNLAGWYRARTGDYRVRFHVQGESVTVDKVGDRKDVYDD